MSNKKNENLKIRFGKIIEAERKASGLSMRKLGQKMDVSYQSISNYEKGENIPTKRNLKKILDILGVNVESFKESDRQLYDYIMDQYKKIEKEDEKLKELIEYDKEHQMSELATMTKELVLQLTLNNSYDINSWIDIPVFSSITSGDLEQNQEVIGKTRIPSEWLYGEHTYFGLKVNDDRNIPYFIEGDILIAQKIDDKYTLGNDEFVIFNINGSNARVGRYHTTGNQVSISFVNESYKPQEISVFDTLKIIGVVKELRRRVV